MTDYGHDLLFGSFLTPDQRHPEQVVGLARLSEDLGLDLVTFQDHPYQPAHLDTWTLMSYVAARTRSIRIAPNVLNLPLRPPAVVARAAASLDLLSGGRFELALGTGAFWDAIEAMGAQRLTPGESVVALDEAVQIIRQIWDTDTRGGVRVQGEHHRVSGAKRGPAPAHPINIWLGAYKPRLLRLTGRVADGWVPSSAYLPPADLGAANEVIDTAARAAGRRPEAVRRLYNVSGSFDLRSGGFLRGPPDQWVDELADLAVAHGISGFILASDEPRALTLFAEEVAPRVRDAVAARRTEGVHRAEGPHITEGAPSVPAQLDAPVAEETAAPGAHEPTTTAASSFPVQPTPDDGQRRTEPLWDESARPTGPRPEPDREYTARELASAQQLVDIHQHLRSELTQIRDLVAQVLDGTLGPGAARSLVNEMTIRQNNWTVGAYCASYCRLVNTHHSLEDQSLFPRLSAADPRLAPVIDRLAEEHVVIHDVLERVDRALVAFVGGPDGDRSLGDAVDLLTDTLLSHLSYEERELVEPLARLGY